ncbi:hypothetical protein Xbed_00093 [Xenorhabdus beddingii]|uniref:Uncharacterized protein n=1 Tax=Xenorhabdus beddingii TaxID=40578 RepID=A0A1Y2SSG9_9GAMM|nr:hypothetical protein Xbed_00093 [Xenorhabdus beddingii]
MVALGSTHGVYHGEPHLDFERLTYRAGETGYVGRSRREDPEFEVVQASCMREGFVFSF